MKNKIIKFGAYTFTVLVLSLLAFSSSYAYGLSEFLDSITDLLASSVIRIIFALAIVYFSWGVVQYMLYPDEGEKKEKGKSMMIWGLIALTVMFSVYGLVRMIQNTFLAQTKVDSTTPIPLPVIKTQ